mmetsp:Transcript_72171/g.127173  ORF Transcript_72171/g.127173 Transcript_72171/m.127173 type:complete len:96 (-) Transcript_72171:164-451(-)
MQSFIVTKDPRIWANAIPSTTKNEVKSSSAVGATCVAKLEKQQGSMLMILQRVTGAKHVNMRPEGLLAGIYQTQIAYTSGNQTIKELTACLWQVG